MTEFLKIFYFILKFFLKQYI